MRARTQAHLRTHPPTHTIGPRQLSSVLPRVCTRDTRNARASGASQGDNPHPFAPLTRNPCTHHAHTTPLKRIMSVAVREEGKFYIVDCQRVSLLSNVKIQKTLDNPLTIL